MEEISNAVIKNHCLTELKSLIHTNFCDVLYLLINSTSSPDNNSELASLSWKACIQTGEATIVPADVGLQTGEATILPADLGLQTEVATTGTGDVGPQTTKDHRLTDNHTECKDTSTTREFGEFITVFDETLIDGEEILLFLTNLDLIALRCDAGCAAAESIVINLVEQHNVGNLLINFIDSRNAFFAYSACKALTALICSTKLKDSYYFADQLVTKPFDQLNSFQGIVSTSEEKMKVKTIYRWQVVTTVLERSCLPKKQVKRCCTNDSGDNEMVDSDIITCYCIAVLRVIMKQEVYRSILYMVQENTVNITNQEEVNDNCLMSILLLIQSSIKYAFTNINETLGSHLKKCQSFFVDITKSLFSCFDPLACKKILDLLILYLINMNKYKKSQDIILLSSKLLLLTTDGVLERLPYCKKVMAFGGSVFATYKDLGDEYHLGDLELLRKLSSLVVKNCEILITKTSLISLKTDALESVSKLSTYLNSKLDVISVSEWLFHLYGDNDNSLISTMYAFLKINNQCKLNESLSKHSEVEFNPHEIFYRFLRTVAHDHSVLLDLLITNETEFLAYFVHYLRRVISNWSEFKTYYCSLKMSKQIMKTDIMDVHSKCPRTDKNEDYDSAERSSDFKDNKFNLVTKEMNFDINDELKPIQNEQVASSVNVNIENVHSNENIKFHNINACKESFIDKHQLGSESSVDNVHFDACNKDVDTNDNGDEEEDNAGDIDDQSTNNVHQSLDDIMSTLIRLNLKIQRMVRQDLFPFNVTSLLKLLETVETLYEI